MPVLTCNWDIFTLLVVCVTKTELIGGLHHSFCEQMPQMLHGPAGDFLNSLAELINRPGFHQAQPPQGHGLAPRPVPAREVGDVIRW